MKPRKKKQKIPYRKIIVLLILISIAITYFLYQKFPKQFPITFPFSKMFPESRNISTEEGMAKLEKNKTGEKPSGGQPSPEVPPIPEFKPPEEIPPPENYTEEINYTKLETLNIFDICSATNETYTHFAEGGVKWCLNQPYPYYMVIERNETHLKTSFYGNIGFNETYLLEDNTAIARLYVEDISGVEELIQGLSSESSISDFMALGEYSFDTIWQSVGGELKIVKEILSFPLILKRNIQVSSDWNRIDFYVVTEIKNYYLGSMYIFIVS